MMDNSSQKERVDMGAWLQWLQIAASEAAYSSRLPISTALRDNPQRYPFPVGTHDWHAVHNLGSRQSTMARVHTGQVIICIHTKLQNKEHGIEALVRAKFKFPGCQKIHISKKWEFTKCNGDEFGNMVAEKQLIPDDCGIKYLCNCGSLDKWWAVHHESLGTVPSLCSPINSTFLSKKKKKKKGRIHPSTTFLFYLDPQCFG